MNTTQPLSPTELYAIDTLLGAEQVEIRDTVRRFADEHLRPHLAGWFEAGELPVRELARELGSLGVLGMHLEGYGCAGTDATSYGLACLELEAADSGIRSLVSVQGSLAMCAIHAYGSEEQRAAVAARHGCRRADRLLRPHRARLPGRTRGRCARPPCATATTGCSRARRCGSPTARSRTSRSCGRDAEGVDPRLRRADGHPRLRDARPSRTSSACARRSPASWSSTGCASPPSHAPGARGLSRPARLPGRGTLRHRVRVASARPATASRPPCSTRATA